MHRFALLISTVLILPAFTTAAQDGQEVTAEGKEQQVDPRWLDRLDEVDRALLDANIGYAPPPLQDEVAQGLRFPNGEAFSWSDVRGKVVVIQSWTSRSEAGRAAPQRAAAALEEVDQSDYEIIAIHTPEGVDNAEKYLARQPLQNMRVIIDERGLLLDELGIFRRPANVVVDRNGVVRFAGLNTGGLREAVTLLVAESANPEAAPLPREPLQQTESAEPPPEFPRDMGEGGNARNIRGQRAPDFFVQGWINAQPNATGKVVIIDFWATWCGPCVQSIPHMNQLAARHPNDLVVVGLSDEPAGTLQQFLRTTQMSYPVASDQSGRMMRAINVSGIPHALVMSSDWIVRWQGHPANLTAQTLDQIVAANKALAGQQRDGRRYRWMREN